MPSFTAVSWGGLTISSDGQDGQNWLLGLDGWESTPSPVVQDSPRSNAHGSFVTPIWSGPRTVTATGFSLSDTARDALFQATQAPMTLPGDTGTLPLSASVVGRTLSADAQFMGYAPVILNKGFWQAGHFSWVIQWRCPDPLRYGPTVSATCGMPSSGGGLVFPLFIVSGVITWGTVPAPQVASVANNGNADTSVLLTVAAGGSALTGGFQIVETVTGSVISYADDLPAGSSVVFDSSSGSVTLNGTADRRGSVTVAQFTQVPKGTTRSYVLLGLVGFSATATLTAAIRPAYL